MSEHSVPRRQVLGGLGAVAVGSIGTYALVNDASATTAQINGTNFNVDDQQHEISGSLADITLSVDVDWSYSADAEISQRILALSVGVSEENLTQVDTSIIQQSDTENSGYSVLESSLLDADSLSLSDFGSEPTTVVAKVEMMVESNGDRVGSDSATETFTISVEENSISVEMGFEATGNTSVSEESEG